MSSCRKCGKSNGIPRNIPLKDMRQGTTRTVKTGSDFLGNRPTLRDQTMMNQRPLKVKNPLNGR